MINFDEIDGFEWDSGNLDKNWHRHRVLNTEAEQIFFNEPLIISDDEPHSSDTEYRYRALGRTNNVRYLFVAFTIRKRLLRIISARDMSKKERNIYNEKN